MVNVPSAELAVMVLLFAGLMPGSKIVIVGAAAKAPPGATPDIKVTNMITTITCTKDFICLEFIAFSFIRDNFMRTQISFFKVKPAIYDCLLVDIDPLQYQDTERSVPIGLK
jgi:hypothetical protein